MPRGQYDRSAVKATVTQPEETPALQTSARAEETRRARRRRADGDLDRMGRMALSIPPEVQERLDREGKTARWVRDASGRQTAMRANDWDTTPGVEPVAEARDSEGKLVLMEKFKDWYDDDQREKTELLDAQEKAIERGSGANRQAGDQLVVPQGQVNRISRQRGL